FELLKQAQYEPLPVEEQVIQIYAATQSRDQKSKHTWVRKYKVKEIERYAKELILFMRANHPQILIDIRDNPKNKIDDAMRKRIDSALQSFDDSFNGELSKEDSID